MIPGPALILGKHGRLEKSPRNRAKPQRFLVFTECGTGRGPPPGRADSPQARRGYVFYADIVVQVHVKSGFSCIWP